MGVVGLMATVKWIKGIKRIKRDIGTTIFIFNFLFFSSEYVV